MSSHQHQSSQRTISSRAEIYEPVRSTPEQLARRILAGTASMGISHISTSGISGDRYNASIGTSTDQMLSGWEGSLFPGQSAVVGPPQAYYVTRNGGRTQRLEDNLPRIASSAPQSRPQFRSKVVCILDCKHCDSEVCKRGMKAILLADMNVELFSTDAPPYGVQLVNDDYRTRNCFCRIRDVACLGCGNVIGYHVTQPCEPCMDACNNGHFWMFHCTEVCSSERQDASGNKALVWSQIPRAERDLDLQISSIQR